MKVQNDSKALEKALKLDADSVKHAGNFIFTCKLNGHDVTINTEPADEEFDTLNVLIVEFKGRNKAEIKTEETVEEYAANGGELKLLKRKTSTKVVPPDNEVLKILKALYDEEGKKEEELKSRTLAMEGSNKFASVEYTPTCRHGRDDCIHDPAYIKATYPEWYAELYGDLTPKEAAQDSRGCAMCKEGELYDDEDK